jgi:hypothetical protein
MKPISRRTVLRGIGATIALPWLDAMSCGQSMIPGRAIATEPAKRIAFGYIPNGVIGRHWFPKNTGKNFDLPKSLEPLKDIMNDILLISGTNRTYLAGADPHSQCASCWMTSAPPNENKDGLTPIDMTLDRRIAEVIGAETAFTSLELSCNSFTDNKEPKFFDAISWYGPGNDAKSENDPKLVFERLFGNAEPISSSVLDTVIGQADKLNQKLGTADRQKMDEYLTSVRSIERQVKLQADRKKRPIKIDLEKPEGIPANRGEYIRLMGDLMLLAFQTDMTRVASLMIGPERWQSPQMYQGVFDKPVDHHVMTHDHRFDEEVAKIDRFHMEQYAYIVQRMKSITEGEQSLLDNCLFVFGSGLGDGNQHSYKELPLIIAGNVNRKIEKGRHLKCADGTPLANVWLSIAREFSMDLPRYADSTGEIAGLF